MFKEFIFEEAPFASAHASTIAETSNGLVAACLPAPAKARATWASGRRAGKAEAG